MLNPPIPQPDPATGLAPLLNIDDAARVLGVSRATVIRLADAGDLAEVRIGSRRLFAPDAIRAYIEAATAEAKRRNAERAQKAADRQAERQRKQVVRK